MLTPRYEIWACHISLYSSDAGVPFFVEDCTDYAEAKKAATETQRPDVAAWVQDKETGEIVE